MDIHRARFVPYPASAINALAFSHPTSKGHRDHPEALRLAIGRANGNIDIWNPNRGLWNQELTLHGGRGRSIEGVCWTQDPDIHSEDGKITIGRLRLFSVGFSASIAEWDLSRGVPRREASGSNSEIWCFAAQPRAKKAVKHDEEQHEIHWQSIVAGCADGSLILFSTADGDLQFKRVVSRPTSRKARVLSVTWQGRDRVVAGFSNGQLRVFDVRNGQLIRTMSMGSSAPGAPKDILVWTVKCLPNGNLVTGDSTGEIRFWDGKNYSLLQRLNGHQADVLDIAVSVDGQTIVSGGVDRRTAVYRPDKRQAGAVKWMKLSHKRLHQHDVKCVAVYEDKRMSVLVSGGTDTLPAVLPLREMAAENSRTLSHLPQEPPLISAPGRRLVVSWWEREVRIWRVGKQPSSGPPRENNETLVAQLTMATDENIASVAIRQDGRLLAIATSAEVKVFSLVVREGGYREGLKVKKLEYDLPRRGITEARQIEFSPDGNWLAIVNQDSKVFMTKVLYDEEELHFSLQDFTALRRHQRPAPVQSGLNGDWGNYERSITRTAFSSNSRTFATSDMNGYIDTWTLNSQADTTQSSRLQAGPNSNGAASDTESSSESESDDQRDQNPKKAKSQRTWQRTSTAHLLPRVDSAPIILSFRPHSSPSSTSNSRNNSQDDNGSKDNDTYLFVVTARHQIYEFSLFTGQLSAWSRRNPTGVWPEAFRSVLARAQGVVWDVVAPAATAQADTHPPLSPPHYHAKNANAHALANGVHNRHEPDDAAAAMVASRDDDPSAAHHSKKEKQRALRRRRQQELEHQHGRARLWLYGANWIWTFDLTRDFPRRPPPTSSTADAADAGQKDAVVDAVVDAAVDGDEGSKKRKLLSSYPDADEERLRIVKRATGAGGLKVEAERQGLGSTVRRFAMGGDSGENGHSSTTANDNNNLVQEFDVDRARRIHVADLPPPVDGIEDEMEVDNGHATLTTATATDLRNGEDAEDENVEVDEEMQPLPSSSSSSASSTPSSSDDEDEGKGKGKGKGKATRRSTITTTTASSKATANTPAPTTTTTPTAIAPIQTRDDYARALRHAQRTAQWWSTYRYRPILGMVVLSSSTVGGEDEGEASEASEVYEDEDEDAVAAAAVANPTTGIGTGTGKGKTGTKKAKGKGKLLTAAASSGAGGGGGGDDDDAADDANTAPSPAPATTATTSMVLQHTTTTRATTKTKTTATTGRNDPSLAAQAPSLRRPVEVVLVERPLWDLDLPPRFMGGFDR